MAARPKLALVWAVAVLLVGVIAAFTKGDDSKVATAGKAGGASTTATTAAGGAISTLGPADQPGATDTTPATATGDTTQDTADAQPQDTAPTQNQPGQPRVTPDPGTYTTTNSGTASLNGSPQPVPPQGTYTIELLPNGDTHQTGDFDLVTRWTPDAASLVSLKIAQANKEFDLNPPGLFIPFSGSPSQWSWSCSSTDGKTTLDQSAQLTANDTVDVGGTPVATFVVDSTIKISGDLTGTVHLTAWVDPVTRLAVKQHTVVNATYLTFNLKSDVTSVLVSLTPS